ncbi:hypothetical protein BIY45_00300 [Stenotrophomonas sp. BIIR7]|nr:hypothetical protein BIY45_00300 [Stenotrophomonas sp. BIIR7]
MDVRLTVITLGLLVSSTAVAQIHTATGPSPKPAQVVPKAAYNSMSNTTTPFNCEQYGWPNHPDPKMKLYCDQLEASTLQGEARRAGRPGPSDDVIRLPALGSEAAAKSGRACVGGQAMRKLPNGWEQVSSPTGGWQRCRAE